MLSLACLLLDPGKSLEQGFNFMPIGKKDLVLTTKEAIQYLKISKPTFLKYIRLGKIKATRAGNGWRIHQSELHRFLGVEEVEEPESISRSLSSLISGSNA